MKKLLLALILVASSAGIASAQNGDPSLMELLVGFIVVFAIGMAARHFLGKKSVNQPVKSVQSGACPHCGSYVEPDAVFCANCGGKLK